MATEEPSVVAAASNAARIARVRGGFCTSSTESIMQAQVQVVDVTDPHAARLRLLEGRAELLELANAQDPMLVRLGGGARDLIVRLVPTPTGSYIVAHLLVDVRDAMGANAVNSMAEAVAARVGRDRRRIGAAAHPHQQGGSAARAPAPSSMRKPWEVLAWSGTWCTPADGSTPRCRPS